MTTTIFMEYSARPEGEPHGPPADRRTGKFVQVRHGGTEYLVFSPKQLTPYHADIVRRFCEERDIEGTYDRNGKRFTIDEPGWTVAGGGKFEINEGEKTLRLFDNSMAYGRFDGKGLREAIRRSGKYSGYAISIEE